MTRRSDSGIEPNVSVGQTSTPSQLVEALHTAFGNHHSRAVHAKGIILEGNFTPSANAVAITKAAHLQGKPSKVLLRFSDFTGIPDIPDTSPSANPRGLSIKFTMDDGMTTDIVGHSFDGFPTPTSDQFRELLLAIGGSGADVPKPTPLDKFLETHPVAKTFLTTQKTPASYATINYFGVNAFKFTNAKGESCFIRYQFITDAGEKLLSAAELKNQGPNYLIDEIKARIAEHPVSFRLYAQIAEAGDKIEDPSTAWPDTRNKVLLGKIELKKPGVNDEQQDKATSFLPGNIQDGIETADPMLDFRSKAYPVSVKERQ